jgi:hypothetical protein
MGLGAQLAAKRQQTRRIISVAEWGDDDQPLQIYASALTCQEFDRIQKKHKDFLSNMTVEGMVDLLILKSENQDGEKMFTLEDKPHLMREPLTLVMKIGAEVFGSITTVEDHAKN